MYLPVGMAGGGMVPACFHFFIFFWWRWFPVLIVTAFVFESYTMATSSVGKHSHSYFLSLKSTTASIPYSGEKLSHCFHIFKHPEVNQKPVFVSYYVIS